MAHYEGYDGILPDDASPDADERYLEALTKMGYSVAESQCFEDGNKRTATRLMQGLGSHNGFDHVFPPGAHDDEELADHVLGWGKEMCPTCFPTGDQQAELDFNRGGACKSCGQVPTERGPKRCSPEQTAEMLKDRHYHGVNTGYVSPWPDEHPDWQVVDDGGRPIYPGQGLKLPEAERLNQGLQNPGNLQRTDLA